MADADLDALPIKKAAKDGQSYEEHSIRDAIDWDRYKREKAANASGVNVAKLFGRRISPGSASGVH